MTENSDKITIPKRVFIVPYRNRIQHKFFFSKYMSFILEDKKDYEIYFSHQCDARTFNRGAVKNIGFIAIKNKYPEHYKNITFIFNDIDTIPFHKIFDYETTPGTVKHYYGFKYALGGIVVMKGADFEKINGFPCYWGWGMEDNALQKRCDKHKLIIDRSNFYEIGKPQILQLFDGISRIISQKDPWRSENDNGVDGLQTISRLNYTIDIISDNPNDNIYNLDDGKFLYINIKTFLTFLPYEGDEYFNYDLREPKRKIIRPDKVKQTRQVVATTDDWSNIPYYPTSKERREQTAMYLIKTGKQVPISLLKQIQKDKEKAIENDVFNITNSSNDTISNMPPPPSKKTLYALQKQPRPNQPNQTTQTNQPQNHRNINNNNNYNNSIKPPQQPHIYSPEYASYVGAKQRAASSVRIKLGGTY
jgi:hypothetical protein